MESKGEHLIGNEDTQYKIEIFDKMNATKRIFIHCEYTLNEKFSFEVVNQGKEESWIRKELN